MRRFFALPLLACALLLASCTRATDGSPAAPSPAPTIVTLLDVTDGIEVTSGGTGTFNWVGQSVTLPAGGPFTNIRFNWYSFRKEPVAFGTLYVLTQEFLDRPGTLGPGTPGVVGRSERVEAGQYIFPAALSLDGGTKYWFYTDTQGSFAGSFDTDIYGGGDMYVSGHPTVSFRKSPASGRMVNGAYVPPPPGVFLDANFKLLGAATR